MGNPTIDLFRDWNDGETINAITYKAERELLRVAIADNFARLIKTYKTVDASGVTKVTQNLTNLINTLNFKEGTGITLSLDNTTSTLTINVTAGSITDTQIAAGVDAVKIGNGDVTNTILSFIKTLNSNAQTQLDSKIPLAQKGAVNGVAPLNGSAKIDEIYLPDTVLGQLEYQTTYNAATNTPVLPAANAASKGWFYIVSVAGIVNSVSYGVGDWIVSDGAAWQKVDNTDAVASFNGRLGAILPATGDYTWAQINKAVSSLADISTRLASDLTGTLNVAQLPAETGDVTRPAGSSVNTIAALAVNTGKIADFAVNSQKLADGGVITVKLADLSVTAAKIANGTITLTQMDLTSLDSRYYTETEVNALLANKAGNAFSTISVTGQQDILADSVADTLKFKAVGSLLITTDPVNDEVTFSITGTGGVSSVNSVDGDIVVTNSTSTVVLDVNSGAGALQLVKRDANGAIPDLVASPLPTALNLGYGLQVLNVTKATPYNVLNIRGRTLVNLLGRDGNCDDMSKWTASGSTLALDTANYVFGTNGMKLTSSGSTGYARKVGSSFNLDTSKYYMFSAYVKNGTGSYVQIGKGFEGGGISRGSSTYAGTTAFSRVMCKLAPSDLNAANIFYVMVLGGAGTTAFADGIAIHEITANDYNNLTTNQLLDKYPYVDDVKHANGIYINRIGENMLPSFDQWTLHANAVVTDPYSLTLNATAAFQNSQVDIIVLSGQTYHLAGSVGNGGAFYSVITLNDDGTTNTADYATGTDFTFTVPANIKKIRVVTANPNIVSQTFTNPRLNLGTVDLGFKPRNDDSLYFPNASLASNVDGTVYDQLYRQDGKWFKETRFVRDYVLDGSLVWAFGVDYAGYKSVFNTSLVNALADSGIVTKFDGKALTKTTYGPAPSGADQQAVGASVNVYLMIADTDSGWGEAYVPTVGEIQAYFWGWQMGNGVDSNPYTSGTKNWRPIKNAGGNNWTTLTTTTPASISDTTYKPYKLTYQLATSTFEQIIPEGSLSLLEGNNQFEVGNGLIVREKVNPLLGGTGFYEINANGNNGTTHSEFKNRAGKLLYIYKNGKLDMKWTVYVSDTANSYGTTRAFISPANFDSTAVYEVTYLALDQYTVSANVQTINGEYDANIKMVVDRLAQSQSDIDARVTVNEKYITDLVPKMEAAMPKLGGQLYSYSEAVIPFTGSGGVGLNLALANVFDFTLTGTLTLFFVNPSPTGAHSFTIAIRQGATSQAIAFPASVKWSNDVIPDLSAINKTSILTFVTFNGGTRWYGMLGANGLVT